MTTGTEVNEVGGNWALVITAVVFGVMVLYLDFYNIKDWWKRG
jgi:hypothetical protein